MAELAIPGRCVVLLVGAAGAGKSTFARRHFPPEAILSSDAMREAIAGNAADQRVNGPAFAALHRALDRRLASGALAVVDATNATAAARRAIRRIAGRHRVPIIAIVLDLPEAIVRARNAGRTERPVPDEVVTRHLAAVARTLDRGQLEAERYARIVRLRTPAEIERLVVRLGP
ncbi:MAG TPA: AAA family ATPase [Candidatus Limnocylindrales bacterium]|nr:AAA family ATPase [Candidatus Limnocylindrales bacterium]